MCGYWRDCLYGVKQLKQKQKAVKIVAESKENKSRFRAAKTVAPRYEGDVIGLPAGAMTITNSERNAAWCDRRWSYGYAVGIGDKGSRPMRFGSAFHLAMEAAYTFFKVTKMPLPDGYETACPLCQVLDDALITETCPVCNGTGEGIVAMAVNELLQSVPPEEHDSEEDRLYRAIDGYFRQYGRYPIEGFDVVAVEAQIASPIINPKTNKVFRSQFPVVDTETGWRLAKLGEQGSTLVSLPMYQLCKLDGILRCQKSGALWVHEFKTSANPQSYGRDLHLDTQLPGYTRALRHAVSLGYFAEKGTPVRGYQWDVVGSRKQSVPKRLKSGLLSTDSRQRVPSWVFKEVMANESAAPYTDAQWEKLLALKDHLAMSVDPTLYHREFGSIPANSEAQYSVELFADAKRIAAMRKASVTIEDGDELAMSLEYPRTPVCRVAGHGCSFTSICLQDSAIGRDAFVEKPTVEWLSSNKIKNQKEEESYKCPF